jgi:hypothetical protein
VRITFTELVHWIHKDYGLSELDAYELLSKVATIHLNEMGPKLCGRSLDTKEVSPAQKEIGYEDPVGLRPRI